MLIRVETEWHLIGEETEDIWQHWNIEKNLISIDGETLDYVYKKPPAYGSSGFSWVLTLSILGIVGVGVSVVLVIRGKNLKKKSI